MTPSRLIATWFGVGLLRPAPGTWGSLAALPFAWGLHQTGGFVLLGLATLAVFGMGWWASAIETRGGTNPDPSEIVIDEVAAQVEAGDDRIFGVMVESNLVAGRQDLVPGQEPVYGQSITDGCIDWDDSLRVLKRLSDAVKARRKHASQSANALIGSAA